MTKVHDFKASLKVGALGEKLFHKRYPRLLKLSGRKGDFQTITNRVVELKTDTYSLKLTENFFIERWSSFDEKKPGGPWQSMEHGAHYFVYMYLSEGVVYWFKAKELVDFMEDNLDTFKSRKIFNKGWTGMGYLVPRHQLEALIYRKDTLSDEDEGLN